MWQCPTKGTYITLEAKLRVDICPSEDSKPHVLHEGTCPCGPQVQMHHNRMHVLHVRFVETAGVDKAMKKLFGK